MDFLVHDNPEDFWAAAGPLYEADPLRHTIALTVLSGLRAVGDNGHPRPLLVSMTDGAEVVGALFWTPPWPLGVSAVPESGIPALVEFLRDGRYEPAGVSGPREPADAFAQAWDDEATVALNMRCYRLQELATPEVPGDLRFAEAADIPLLAAMERAFLAEANPHQGDDDHQRRVMQSLALGNAHGIWTDGGDFRAMARASAPQRGMSRVGMVYTPPEHRKHGYGAAVTAAVSDWALAQGAQDVVLFTDLANPISNSIYQRIGYTPVYDAVEYRFPSTVAE